MSRVSRRSLAARLADLRVEETLDDVFIDDLAARLQSLAVAASFEVGVKKGRLRRKFVAAVGSIGVIGWISVTGAAASVGLATTGNLPAPVQDVVSTVFEVVGIDIPTSSDSDPAPVEPVDDAPAVEVDEVPVESTPAVETTLSDEAAPVETTVPEISDLDSGAVVEETPTPVTRPGNSGNTPAVTAPGQVKKDDEAGDDEKPSATAPGQVKKDDEVSGDVESGDDDKPSVTAPGQVKKDDEAGDDESGDDEKPSATAPGQVKKSDDEDAESSGPGKSGDAPGRTNKQDD